MAVLPQSPTPGSPTLEELTNEVHKLDQLLQDPYPGLFTWNEFVQEQSKKVMEMLEKIFK